MVLKNINDPSGYCDHCGNVTFKIHQGECSTPSEKNGYYCYRLYQCTICRRAVLEEVHVFSRTKQIIDQIPESHKETRQLWPLSLRLPPEAPERVRQIYDEARSVMRKSPSSFVVQIGRAMEAITRDKQVEGRSLFARMENLINQENLPKILGEMSDVNRIFRNWGAHDTEISIEPDDVEIADGFFKALIEYLYVAPARLESVKKILLQRREQPKSEEYNHA